jgi:hypothetical protein
MFIAKFFSLLSADVYEFYLLFTFVLYPGLYRRRPTQQQQQQRGGQTSASRFPLPAAVAAVYRRASAPAGHDAALYADCRTVADTAVSGTATAAAHSATEGCLARLHS